MKITSSSIDMASQHRLVEQDIQRETVEYWGGGRRTVQTNDTSETSTNNAAAANVASTNAAAIADISQQAKDLLDQDTLNGSSSVKATGTQGDYDLSDADKQKLELIKQFIKALTGKNIKFLVPRMKLDSDGGAAGGNGQSLQTLSSQRQPVNVTNAAAGWGVRYDSYRLHSEQESTSFAARGVVKTADGKEINLSVDVNMSRQFVSEQSVSIRAGDALKDPLVINFGGNAAQLTTQKYKFDIDSDGKADQISFVGPGSGFLALDKDGDGKVTNGKELFGTESGNGFADLKEYDSDGNGWIDESDPIYSKLRIWSKDASGADQLLALGQQGVGAIYLGNVSTEFAVKDSANQLDGQVRSTGLFLRENGTAGTVQQIDLAI